MANPFEHFETDTSKEKEGVRLDFGDYWFMVARPGGKNEAFGQILQQRLERITRGPQSAATSKLADSISRSTFIELCLRGWGSTLHGDGIMVGRSNEAIPFSAAAADKLFQELPDLLASIISQVNSYATFRKTAVEDDAGN